MGILVEVLAREGSGEARYPKGLVLVEAFGEPVGGPFGPADDLPAVAIRKQVFAFGEFAAAFLVTLEDGKWSPVVRDGCVGPMADGKFIYTVDGRYATACGVVAGAAPVKLMDRWETTALTCEAPPPNRCGAVSRYQDFATAVV